MANTDNEVRDRQSFAGVVSALTGVVCPASFWILAVLSNYVRLPLWLNSQLRWQVTLLVAVALAVWAAFLRARFGWLALAVSLTAFLFVMYAAGV